MSSGSSATGVSLIVAGSARSTVSSTSALYSRENSPTGTFTPR